MQRLRFKKIDAFVYSGSGGNPAGCIYLDRPDAISPDQMQQIAREMAGCVSEVVYVYRENDIVTLRFFSSECEVAFCGHGTVAAMNDLIKYDPDLLRNPIISIHIGDRQILIRNTIAEEDAVFVSAPLLSTPKTEIDPDAVAAALKLPPGEIVSPGGITVISAGLVTLIVPLHSLAALLATRPDQQHLKEFCIRHGIEIVLVHTAEVSTDGAAYRTRVFAPAFGYLEDPATGSGNAALGYHLLASGAWDGKMIRIEQGRSRDHPNIIRLVSDASEKQRTVFFGGNAVVRIEGEYLLQ
ncbi:MAG: PhzF family phenazine biosynthesis protein [Methanoregula sp.]|jgi:PhzF family phenazine biosynthesis protein|nr:PhzF family phenazine biosynthesis protein [Methanoregula sp.]